MPIRFPELTLALESTALERQDNPFVLVEVTEFYEVPKCATTSRARRATERIRAAK